MKILVVGDPHGSLEKIKKIPKQNIDLILLTGDLGKADLVRKMAFENIERKKRGLPEKEFSPQQKKRGFMEAYSSSLKVVRYLSRYSPVYTIFGNVESSNFETRKNSKEIGLPLPFLTNSLNSIKGVKVINNRFVKVYNIKIGGLEYFIDTCWVREFKPSDYKKRLSNSKKDSKKAKSVLNSFRKLDILVCHQPPYGYLDTVSNPNAPKHWKGKHAGSKVILDYIKKQKPKYVFCGHIHEGEGKTRIGNTLVYNLGVGGYKIIEID